MFLEYSIHGDFIDAGSSIGMESLYVLVHVNLKTLSQKANSAALNKCDPV